MKLTQKTRRILIAICAACVLLAALVVPLRNKGRAYFSQCDICLTGYLIAHHIWLLEVFFKDNLLRAMMMMTEQMNAVGMHQMFIFGQFLDAKHQLETQRLFQEQKVSVYRDYTPSENYCWWGTNTRSLAASEHTGDFNTRALNMRQMARHLGNYNLAGAYGRDQDKESRWKRFLARYCDPQNNHWEDDKPDTGMTLACGVDGAGDTKLINLDIDYPRLIEEPRSLNIAFHRTALSDPPFDPTVPEPNEEDIIALGNNLYGHNQLTRKVNSAYLKSVESQKLYLKLRSVAAKRSVAENSYNSIVGLKTYGSVYDPDKDYHRGQINPDGSPVPPNAQPKTHKFLAAVLVELGMDEDEVFDIIGARPSYYAQMEILAKKIYQNPTFYARLYDKPANVVRTGAAMQSIKLMLERDMYESQLRREMILSTLLSTRLHKHYRNVNKELPSNSE